MGTTRLKLYKGALRAMGETTITTLSDTLPARYKLDEVWDDDFIDLVLQHGLWNFAMKTSRLDYDPDADPEFGPDRAFEKPDDWVLTAGVSLSEDFNPALSERQDGLGFWDERGMLFANADQLYFKYVSNDEQYGSDLSLWPANFSKFAAHLLGQEATGRVTQSKSKEKDMFDKTEYWLNKALKTDALNQTAQEQPQGSWSRARMTRRGNLSRQSGGWR